MREKTVSLWSFLNSRKEKYLNVYYTSIADLLEKKKDSALVIRDSDPETLKHLLEETIEQFRSKETHSVIKLDNLSTKVQLKEMLKLYPEVLRPGCSLKRMRLWEEYFLYYSPLSFPMGLLSNEVMFQEYY